MNEQNDQRYVDIIKSIVLKQVPLDSYTVFLFGSRAVGNAHPMSDIDIGFMGTAALPVGVKARIEEEIDESVVPFHVDLVDFYQVTEAFKEEALKKTVIWNLPKSLLQNG
ncbi:nucleotidyltransferase domain-containing protein (plasmid) [Pedobacter sp. BS3]|uniref:nucleotidyltransferase family protein n=1 Tax=Pedobacter sp. BS3 TaxID=2567937 RepID=UPI0011EF1276|nr:nucleotidyltransferase domain-containing protein [Pedobacter sp. BS3]TZF86438.1 nucleotidyltransferase domain-containing protein [Pedobacter sp. BS3]